MAADKNKSVPRRGAYEIMRVRADRYEMSTMRLIYAATFVLFLLWVIGLFGRMAGGGLFWAVFTGAVTVGGFVWFYLFFLGKYIRITLTIAIALFGIIWGLALMPKTLTGGEGDIRMGGKLKMDVVKKKYEDLPPPPTLEAPTEVPKGLETKGNIGSVPLPVPDEEAEAETIADAGPGVEDGALEGTEIEVIDEGPVDADISAPTFDVEYSEAPVITHEVKPIYPDIAKASRWEGDVVLFVYIDTDGGVRNVVVASSSGFTDVDNAAVKAAYKCHFKPAKQQGVPVAVWYSLVMEFRL